MSTLTSIARHRFDRHVALLDRPSDMEVIAEEDIKAGILAGALPEDVKSLLLNMPPKDLFSIAQRSVVIDPDDGMPAWTGNFLKPELAPLREFIETLTPSFQRVCGGKNIFGIQLDAGTRVREAPKFHVDSKFRHIEQKIRALISISDGNDNHETEWVATDELNQRSVSKYMGQGKDIQDLADLAKHVQIIGSGDMAIFKGVSYDKRDLIRDGFIHRAPPYKNIYPEIGKRRLGLVLDHVIDLGNDYD